ncbi:MAG: nuclear transport factor 2 family protein [Terracidiphilus sp.]
MPAESPEACDELYARHLNTRHFDSLVALYEPDGSNVRHDGTAAHGHFALRQDLRQFAATEPELHVRVKKIVLVGQDLAVIYDHWTLFTNGPGSVRMQTNGKSVHVVRRQAEGGWLFAVTGLTNSAW